MTLRLYTLILCTAVGLSGLSAAFAQDGGQRYGRPPLLRAARRRPIHFPA